MAKAARKSIRNEDLKRVLPVAQGLRLAENAEANIHALEKAGMAGFGALANGYRAWADMWKNSCGGNLRTCIGNSENSVTDVFGAGQRLLEGWQKMDDEVMALWRDAAECRSFDEFYNLQRRTASLMMGDWFKALQRSAATAHMMPIMNMFVPD